VDFSKAGLELAQVSLGFGANAFWGALSNKRGLPIAEDASKKLKGEGMVPLRELQRREIARVLRGARRNPIFVSTGEPERDAKSITAAENYEHAETGTAE
jgi:hypothetical protein